MSFFRRLKMPPVPNITGTRPPSGEGKRGKGAPGGGVLPMSSGKLIEDYLRKVLDALSAWNPDASPIIVGEAIDGAVLLADTATIEATQSGSTVSLEVVDDSITDAKLRDSVGFSVIGRAATGTGETADIASGTDAVLGRVGSGNLAFQQVATGQVADDAITYAKIQNVSAASRLLGRGSAGGAGNVEELTLALGLSLVATVLTMVPVVLRPSQVTGDQNDYSPGTFGPDRTTVFVNTDASRNFTGILATGIADGVSLLWVNNGTQSEVLQNENAGSAEANRLICPAAGDFTVIAGAAVQIVRDSTANRWRVYSL